MTSLPTSGLRFASFEKYEAYILVHADVASDVDTEEGDGRVRTDCKLERAETEKTRV